MRLVLKPSAFDNSNFNDLLKIKLIDKNIYLKEKDTYIGFETEEILQKLLSWMLSYSIGQMNLFKVLGKSFFYIQEKLGQSPLTSSYKFMCC